MGDAVRVFAVCTIAATAAACTDDQDPAGAAELWDRIQAMDYRGTFATAPGHDQRVSSRAAHGDEVQIFVNDLVADALAGPPIDEWPLGSLVVKDGYSGGDVCLVAAMEKRDDGWFWVEWDEEGSSLFSGAPTICTGCHRIGEDWVRGFFLP